MHFFTFYSPPHPWQRGAGGLVEDRHGRIPPFDDGGCGAPDDDGVEHNRHSSWGWRAIVA